MVAAVACAVALSLAIDVSNSITPENMRLQQIGFANAFRAEEVTRLFSPEQPVAVHIIAFGDEAHPVLGWRVLRTVADAEAFADEIEQTRFPRSLFTAVAHGMRAAIDAFETVPCEAERMVVDVSGDGPENVGGSPTRQRDRAVEMGIEINGLPIVIQGALVDLSAWYRENVITPGNWIVASTGFEDFGRAIRAKLSTEIAGTQPPQNFALQGWSESLTLPLAQ
jgi:Protein of unknown function (DUF1194)